MCVCEGRMCGWDVCMKGVYGCVCERGVCMCVKFGFVCEVCMCLRWVCV